MFVRKSKYLELKERFDKVWKLAVSGDKCMKSAYKLIKALELEVDRLDRENRTLKENIYYLTNAKEVDND